MKERPILFNSEMVRAVLDGRKTQTRRVMTEKHRIKGPVSKVLSIFHTALLCFGKKTERYKCPYGKIGDQMWVRETFTTKDDDGDPLHGIIYKASWKFESTGLKWTPSIFMPRWASRIQLEIIDIRIERVQDMSLSDARAEGIVQTYGDFFGNIPKWAGDIEHEYVNRNSKENFSRLWNSINEKRGFSWESNPWVWVVEFKRINHER